MNKVVIVTGASAGIGYATAKLLSENGCIVYALARRIEKMEPLKAYSVTPIKCDVTDIESVKSAVAEVMREQGKIDVLFNNAGYGSYGAVEDVPLDEARSQFEVNLFGLAAITKEVLPIMRKQESGLIINNSSMGGKMYSPLGAWYHATKYAIEGFSDCLRFETQPFGIKVAIIEPGDIDTAWNDIMLDNVKKRSANGAYAEQAQGLERMMHNIGKFSKPDIIAKAVLKAVSSKKPKTRYLVGKNSKTFVFLRSILSDRMYDKALRFMINRK
mgnify:CR=1 FL=1